MDELLDAINARVESAKRGKPPSLFGRNRQESFGLDRLESIVLAAGRKQPCAVVAKNFVQLVNNVTLLFRNLPSALNLMTVQPEADQP